MNPIIRNILAVVAGIIVGAMVNGALIDVSANIIPLPDGVDPSDMESLKENMHRFKPINFLMPFLAHALGTLSGAILAVLIAASSRLQIALGIGSVFLLGGIAVAVTLPAPMWFNIVDIVGAYIPMGWLGWKLADGNIKKNPSNIES